MKIITNNHWNNFLYWYELTEKEQAEFDWIENPDEHTFFRYRGWVYSLDDFMLPNHVEELEEWDGYRSDSFFSGVLIKLSDDGEMYQVGTYIS